MHCCGCLLRRLATVLVGIPLVAAVLTARGGRTRRAPALVNGSSHLKQPQLLNATTAARTRRHRTARAKSSVDHLVTDSETLKLPRLSTKHYAGHIPLSSNHKDKERNLFYWLFAPDSPHDEPEVDAKDYNKTDKTNLPPLVIWLNGGPGYSSLAGLFLEHGPFQLVYHQERQEWKMQTNPHSWHTAPAWVLYVDQPVGTGLSYTDDELCTNDECINADFYAFLNEFFWLHRDTMLTPHSDYNDTMYVLKGELFFTGESYAGHFIPTIVDHILRQNDSLNHTDTAKRPSTDANDEPPPPILMPISGMAIGNGYMDPRTQYSNAEALFGHGLIDISHRAHFDKMEAQCVRLMDDATTTGGDQLLRDAMRCFEDHFDSFRIVSKKGDYCDYDARLWLPDGGREYPPGKSELEAYLGGGTAKTRERMGLVADVDPLAILRAIHAATFAVETGHSQKRQFRISSDAIGASLCRDTPHSLISVTDEVVRILEAGVPTLFYNGVQDLMCDHAGNERFLDRLPWTGRSDWTTAQRFAWWGDAGEGAPAGFAKEFGNLSFLKLMGAGHMVPMDQPAVSLAMLRTFLRGNKYRGSKQILGQAQPPEERLCHTQDQDKTNTGDDISTHKEAQEEITTGFTDKEATAVSSSVEDSDIRIAGLLKGLLIGTSVALVISLAFWAGRRSNKRHGETYNAVSVNDGAC